MGFLSEFKSFIIRGNVIDLAIGIIIGAAFNKIVSSLIEDVITPLMLKPLLEAAQVNTLQDFVWHKAKIGMFVSAVITFLLTALVLFAIVRSVNALRRKEEVAPAPEPALSRSEKLLEEIRDELRSRPA